MNPCKPNILSLKPKQHGTKFLKAIQKMVKNEGANDDGGWYKNDEHRGSILIFLNEAQEVVRRAIHRRAEGHDRYATVKHPAVSKIRSQAVPILMARGLTLDEARHNIKVAHEFDCKSDYMIIVDSAPKRYGPS